MTTPACPCGGQTYVDDFLWPRKPIVYFLRCEECGAMGDAEATHEAAEKSVIKSANVAETST